ncbi:MAG: glucosaminidase domain-containing protein [Bacteroidota bacterium]
MRSVVLLIFVLFIGFFTSCSSSKKTVSSKSKKEEKIKKEQILYSQSDKVFNEFNKKHGEDLNQYTLVYIEKYKVIAIDKMLVYNIPASITLAQGILESGSGRSELSRKSNNHFGIKCHKDWNGKKVRYDDDRKRECFRKYDEPEGSFNDHSIFLTSRNRYASLFELKPNNYKAWAKGLKKAGYATDRKYSHKLINLIEDYHLYDYDDLVLKKKGYVKTNISKEQAKKTTYSNKIIIVSTGDTLYSIAKNNKTTVERLKEINDLSSNEINIGQKLIVSE